MAYGSTIAAISTPPGKGGVAIIRISGDDALEIAKRVFVPRGKEQFSEASARRQIYGDILYGKERIDDGMATYFKAPASYTGEDTVEISCHGGILITRTVLEAVFAAGAMPAEPGEFTKRAFINGKLSLGETEAIGGLLEAQSREQIRLTSIASREALKDYIDEIRGALTELLSSIFARIDYPDEDLGELTGDEIVQRLIYIKEKISALIATYPTGRAIAEGVKTVICGRTNVGKSTLYNAIVGEDAAIVTDIEGTTRDVLTTLVPLGKIMLRLSDTAGIRATEGVDKVEKIGIGRTKAAIADAELIIAVFDSSRAFSDEDAELLADIGGLSAAKIAVVNKTELERKFDTGCIADAFDEVIYTSMTDGALAVRTLSECAERLFTDEKLVTGECAIVSSARQNAALVRAGEFVDAALAAFRDDVYQDAAASEIERALGAIAEIDGRAAGDEVVADIFAKFCVGK